MNSKKPFRVFATDISTVDKNYSLIRNPALQAVADSYGCSKGSKGPLDDAQLADIAPRTSGNRFTEFAGGSSANTLATLSKLMGKDAIDIDFLSVVPEKGHAAAVIEAAMQKAELNLIRAKMPEGVAAQEATSYIFKHEDGEKSSLTHSGTARQALKKSMLKPDMMKDYDAIMVQGALWQKFDWDFVDELLDQRWKHGKELWLTLPTVAKFGESKKDFFEWLTRSANLVLANIKELALVEGVIDASVKEENMTVAQKDEALRRLQASFNVDDASFPDKQRMVNRHRQVGFITDGKYGSHVVTKDDIKYYPTEPLPVEEIANSAGIGDTAFAGFIYGYLNGMSHENSAKIGMALAKEKLREDAPRLMEPKNALKKVMPYLGHMLADSREPLDISNAK
ncbi:MAG: carbohydrate kinase family protein [Alphaproteobacteria bacterium]